MQLLDLSQGLPDAKWLGSTKQVANYVAPKSASYAERKARRLSGVGDSGLDQLSIAPGAGRAGNDCLLVTSPDEKAGLPGFWVLRGRGNGKGSVAFFRIVTSGGTAVVQGTVGTAGADLNLNSVSISAGSAVSVTAFTITEANS